MTSPKSLRLKFACPHCLSRTVADGGLEVSPLRIEIRYACTDFECGHTFTATLEAVRTLIPSNKPNPDIHLPVSGFVAKGKRGAKAVTA
ncbi:ogr/Delta-like zinc finger family protein [Burkholderia sp. WP9]|uniref:ogr/Delta-like zinc finger family protein n=1 Tax=Pseudomonadota TaxID=1224 RepID=UPI0008999192|nr:Ogr/Delta-like zinc finger [Burkholderia sp. WP9]